MVEFLLEVVVEFFFEFLLSLVGEVLAELFSRASVRWLFPERWREGKRYFLLPAFFCAGIALGAISVWFFPNHFIASPNLRWANLMLTPVFVALASALFSSWRLDVGGEKEPLRHAAQGFLFAFALALTRFLLAV